MTRLLVSVRSAEEAMAALDGGADVIDVKEPRRGSLGAADANVVRSVVQAAAGRAPVSVALGELLDSPRWSHDELVGVSFAKLGLAGCGDAPDWLDRFRQSIAKLPHWVRPAAVVYADWIAARAPDPGAVIAAARDVAAAAVLVDTYDKSGGGLTRIWQPAELQCRVNAIRGVGASVVLAGSLTAEALDDVLPLTPDLVAVRGAACRGGRDGTVDRGLVEMLARRISAGCFVSPKIC